MSGKQASAKDIAQKVLSKARGAGQAVGAAAKDIGRGAMRGAKNIGGGARSVAQAARKHPYAAAGIGAGAAGAGVLGAAALKKDEKTAAEIAKAVLQKFATSSEPISDHEKAVMQWLTGPAGAAVRAPKGEKGRAFGSTQGSEALGGLKGTSIGLGAGGAGGAGIGALAALLSKGRVHPGNAALMGGIGGGLAGAVGGGALGLYQGRKRGLERLQERSQGWPEQYGKLKPEEAPAQATSKAASAIADAVLAKFSTP